MRLPGRDECRFRTVADGRRAYYGRGWRGPGLLLRNAAQEAALRRELGVSLWIFRSLTLLLWIVLALSARHSAPLHDMARFGLPVLGALALLSALISQWRTDHLLNDGPGVVERLTRGDHYACLAAHLSTHGIQRRAMALLLIGAAAVGLGPYDGLRGNLIDALPLLLSAAVMLLPLQRLLQVWKHRSGAS